MSESHNYARDKRVHSILFNFYQLAKISKLIHRNRNNISLSGISGREQHGKYIEEVEVLYSIGSMILWLYTFIELFNVCTSMDGYHV